MNIGLIDVDGSDTFPNIAIMKLSAWHKQQGDHVEWYDPNKSPHMDRVYMSKVFSFTDDYPYEIDADEIIKGGTGYCIDTVNGIEEFHKERDIELPYEIEHIYPDYDLYGIKDKAYGFMTRGCPRHCHFCIVGDKEGCKTYTVAKLSEFWRGQRDIILMDPNPVATIDWKDNFQQLIDSKSYVDFTQGVDIRLMTEEKAEYIKQIKLRKISFSWDQYCDKEMIVQKFKLFKDITGLDRHKMIVNVLVNFNTSIAEDLDRIYILRDIGYMPWIMIYGKYNLPRGHIINKLAGWVNWRPRFKKIKYFIEYDRLSDKQREYLTSMGLK